MIPLRLRLALLLFTAIVTVVVLAAVITTQIVERGRDGSFNRAFAEEVSVVTKLVGGSAERAREAGIALGSRPDGRLSRRLNEELMAFDLPPSAVPPSAVIVTTDENRRQLAFPVTESEWAYLSYPSRPPSPFRALVSYLSLVVLGAIVVSFLVAARILGPMRMIENALASVGPEGVPPPIPEKGPPETRATAQALNRLSARLKSAMESRMRLVAAAGHDLRTPMTRLRLRAEFLPDEDRTIWLRDLDELDQIADSAIRLVREEAEQGAFETVSLRRLAEDVVREVSEIGLEAEIAPGEVPALVRGQPLALKRALRNLVENAARHGGGAQVQVTETSGRAVFRVEDDGPGIPEDLLAQAFEPFFRVDAARRKVHKGAGLGLAIAREIVERNGGTITIRNRVPRGLLQEVSLPLGR
ncbi:MAG: HAMP domain-containing protein [Methylobacterium mesophilicum]|nr:HAMP domain-containing protein [Methylobacterium mesophilicum]